MKKVVKLTLVGYLDFKTAKIYPTKKDLQTAVYNRQVAKEKKQLNKMFAEALIMAFIADLRKNVKRLINSIRGWNSFKIWAKISKLKDLIVEAKYELFFGKKTNLI